MQGHCYIDILLLFKRTHQLIQVQASGRSIEDFPLCSVFLYQFIMGAMFHYPALFHNVNGIGIQDLG